jgi:hypothetical protein
MRITIERLTMTSTTTIGKMYLNGEYFGYTLEDVNRDVKIKHQTCIPAGLYKVVLTVSNRFKRLMPLLIDVPNFKGIRIHGGNTHKNTSGCPMVAERRLNDNTIQGSLEKELTKRLKECDNIEIEIINKFSF